MCTVSIVPREDGYRLLCNRDELRSRPLAEPPRWTTSGGVLVAYPTDPLRGGTWVAVSQHGLTVALLNRGTPAPRTPRLSGGRSLRSRGEIPLALVGCGTLDAAQRRLVRLDPAAYAGFLVLVVWFDLVLAGESDGARLSVGHWGLHGPVAFTSSSLGDRDAERARLPLFQSLVVDSSDPWTAQRAFHDHQWPAWPQMSIRMRRADARTVSRTRIDVKGGRVALDYEPLADVS